MPLLLEAMIAGPLSRSHFLALRDHHPGESFLALNSQADYGSCSPSRNHFWRLNHCKTFTGIRLNHVFKTKASELGPRGCARLN
jgi:hypothetical protein